ncbi:hypothetical protein [Bacillus sp. T33-2]|uniref:hypothetical protein n=1 Tax=Bacillus sp. T33-2 TaxID=2054168 RepID=UPI000C7921EA|nr:hypothetical protein [Bacillus sp. T33-2]PLR96078.1 hypothetical protein CVD19_12260 [Bacillus sp. T33-2]
MHKKLELTDYQLWMCGQIKEKLAEFHYVKGIPTDYPSNCQDREVVSLALSEMLVRLGGFDTLTRKID